jgi:hypothetical protein
MVGKLLGTPFGPSNLDSAYKSFKEIFSLFEAITDPIASLARKFFSRTNDVPLEDQSKESPPTKNREPQQEPALSAQPNSPSRPQTPTSPKAATQPTITKDNAVEQLLIAINSGNLDRCQEVLTKQFGMILDHYCKFYKKENIPILEHPTIQAMRGNNNDNSIIEALLKNFYSDRYQVFYLPKCDGSLQEEPAPLLLYAADQGNIFLVKLLLDRRGGLSEQKEHINRALHHLKTVQSNNNGPEFFSLTQATISNHTQIEELLNARLQELEEYIIIQQERPETRNNLLKAIKEDDLPLCKKALKYIDYPLYITPGADGSNKTTHHDGIQHPLIEVLKIHNPNIPNQDRTKIINELIGHRFLHVDTLILQQVGKTKFHFSPLWYAVDKGDSKLVEALLPRCNSWSYIIEALSHLNKNDELRFFSDQERINGNDEKIRKALQARLEELEKAPTPFQEVNNQPNPQTKNQALTPMEAAKSATLQ